MSPNERAIFHLAFPVRCLDTALDFYTRCLGASTGRRQAEWADVVLFGHQLTLHAQPGQVLARSARGVRHFGAVLSWDAWDALRMRLQAVAPGLAADIRHFAVGEPGEHIKLLLEDPDANLVEIKAYRSTDTIAPALATPSTGTSSAEGCAYACLWEFRVPEAHREAFERHYCADGTWAALFRRHPGYLATLLLADREEVGRYLTIDRWASERDYAQFRSQHADAYQRLDRECEGLTSSEALLGAFLEPTPGAVGRAPAAPRPASG